MGWLAPAMAINAVLVMLGVFWHQWVEMHMTPHRARYFLAWLPVAAGFFLLYVCGDVTR